MTKPLRLSAMGGASGDVLGVEDVFSTYLYRGNGNSLGNDVPTGIQFGGVPTNGTILHLTGDSLSDSAPVPCPFTSVGVGISTSTKKYGTGALSYNGTSTNILTAASAALRFGTTGDFTVECWVYNSSAGNQGVFHLGNDFGQGCVFVNMYPANQFQWGYDGSYTGGVGSFPSSTWIHVALVRQSGVLKLYINGTKTGSDNTFAGNISLGRIWVGNYYDTNYAWNGNIDDFRVSNKAVYTGNFTPPTAALAIDTIVAGSNYGGMTWMKCRTTAYNPVIFDTLRGGTNTLRPATTAGNATDGGSIAFNTSGWCVNTSNAGFNAINDTYVSWSFRRQPKFFDVVTWTGDGTSNRQISHSLGSTPGCVIVKNTGAVSDWTVYHRSLGFSTGGAPYNGLRLNGSTPVGTYDPPISAASSTTITVTTSGSNTNQSGQTFVAYLFAHDAGGFGATGNDNVISCGSFVSTGANQRVDVDLGYQPQWLLVKQSNGTGSQWYVLDNLRGFPAVNVESTNDPTSRALYANLSNTEGDYSIALRTNGFSMPGGQFTAAGETYIYIAIRRPNKVPTIGTQVYKPLAYTGTGTSNQDLNFGFPVDMWLHIGRSGVAKNNLAGYEWPVFTRLLTNGNAFNTTLTNAWGGGWGPAYFTFDNNYGIRLTSDTYFLNANGGLYSSHGFKRAPGFFDIVSYQGNATNRTIGHGLGVAPELMIVKRRDSTSPWSVYAAPVGATKVTFFDTAATINGINYWNSTAPTSSVFSLGVTSDVNASGGIFIAYLFASCPGVSKVGTYTGNGSSQTINCGFTGGARFLLIKRTSATGDWFVWDTARGIVSGNDPYQLLNSSAGEVTTDDSIDPDSTGFIVNQNTTTNINVNAATYIYLAIA